MQTDHRIEVADARTLALPDDSVDLVVTSPPYPMIELWDDLFSTLDPAIEEALDAGDGDRAFELMHDILNEVWGEVARVLAPGGVVCVNVGDATRRLDDRFQQYPNHAVVIDRLTAHGLDPLPDILWRKPVNRMTKFMGSGMLPPNAYATLEHEYILVFRKGGPRQFAPGEPRRYESAYFWEERNEWFSDLWTDVVGASQPLDADSAGRDRSGAFPLAIPYRLISMFSVYGDTVLDPFWGTGTTTLAAMLTGRNSVGYELDDGFLEPFDERINDLPERSRALIDERIDDHRRFIAERESTPAYDAEEYDFRVVTSQETEIQFYAVDQVDPHEDGYRVTHAPHPNGID